MNKTININLAGIIFHLDEVAYRKLTEYLTSIKGKFEGDPSQSEIISDIEARIAEIFQEKLSGSKEVISLEDVDHIITIMGTPEDYESDDEQTNTSKEEETQTERVFSYGKKLYRNPDDKILGGVSSGIAAYLGVDVIWIRLLWVFLFLTWGTGLFLYIILWIVMPEATTTAQKLQMRGEPINVSNIEKSVKQELKNVGDRVEKIAKDPKLGTRFSNFIENLVNIIISIIKFVFQIAFRLVGVFLLILGFGILISLIGGIFGHEIIVNDNMFGWYDVSGYLDQILLGSGQRTMLFLGVFMLAVAPIVWLFMLGMALLFKYRSKTKIPFVASGLISLAGFIMVISVGVSVGRDFRNKSHYISNIPIENTTNETYFLTIDDMNQLEDNELSEELNWFLEDETQYLTGLKFDIKKSDDSRTYLRMKHSANGSSRKEARERSKNYEYKFEQRDSLLLFGDYYSLPKNEKWRKQELELTLYIPVGTKVFLDEDMIEIIHDIDNVTNTYDSDMLNHNWLMTQNGLACLDCKPSSESDIEEYDDSFEDQWEEDAKKLQLESEIKELEERKKELEMEKKKLEQGNVSAMESSSSQLYFLPVNSPLLREQREQHVLVV